MKQKKKKKEINQILDRCITITLARISFKKILPLKIIRTVHLTQLKGELLFASFVVNPVVNRHRIVESFLPSSSFGASMIITGFLRFFPAVVVSIFVIRTNNIDGYVHCLLFVCLFV